MPRHIRKGDTVIVTKGSSKGVVGEVLRVVDEGERVVVKGANIRTYHMKPTQQRPQLRLRSQRTHLRRRRRRTVVAALRQRRRDGGQGRQENGCEKTEKSDHRRLQGVKWITGPSGSRSTVC